MKKMLMVLSFVIVSLFGVTTYADNSYWKLDVYHKRSQIFTGTYWATNCAPTTMYHVLGFTGKEFDGTIEDIRRVMVSQYSDYIGRGITYYEMMKFVNKEELGLVYEKKAFDYYRGKEECREYILKTLETSIITAQVDLQYNREAYELDSFTGHSVIIAGSFTFEDQLYLYILDPWDGTHIVWDYDTWWLCYTKWFPSGTNYYNSFKVTSDNTTLVQFVEPSFPFEELTSTMKRMPIVVPTEDTK